MKLWEAMLKGSKMKPQCFGLTYENGGSCAVGAANDGGYRSFYSKEYDTLGQQPCPVCNLDRGFNSHLIPHLNDDHKWSRECIAYYIRDTFELGSIKVEEPKHEILV